MRLWEDLKLVGILILLGLVIPCYGTDYGPRDYTIVPPAPVVSAFMDLAEYPVDNFHGIPDISFPLYTLKCGSIEVPIILTYHGGGVRVKQKAGNAGLGWSVTYGAQISHTVYGAPDDANGTMHGLLHLNSDEKFFRENLMVKDSDYDPTDGSHYKEKLSWQATKGETYYEGECDVANDLFQLQGLGMSAVFTIMPSDNGGRIIASSESSINITRYGQTNIYQDGGCDNYGFEIESNKGLKYKFSTQDRTKYEFKHGSPQSGQRTDSIYYSSAWHLDEITDLNNNRVEFNYQSGNTFLVKDLNHAIAIGYSNPDLAQVSYTQLNTISSIKHFSRTIHTIKGSGITVEFNYASPETTTRDAFIKSITITAPDNTKRVIKFEYCGCFLQEIVDQGQNIYTFEYNNDGFDIGNYTKDQDFGGFYNSAYNTSLIPNITTISGIVGRGSERSVNPQYSTDASLRRISYATGGYTEFEWESNTFSHLNEYNFKGKINSDIITGIDTDTIRACLEHGYEKLEIRNWRIQQGQRAILDLTKYFDMNPANLFGSAYHDRHDSEGYIEDSPTQYPHLIVRNRETSKIVAIYYLDKETIEPGGTKSVIDLWLPAGIYDFKLVNPYEVQGAEDFIEAEFRSHELNCGYIYLSRISTDRFTSIGRQNWCGLRIKCITSCAGDTEHDVLRKYFYYNKVKDPNETSGTVQQVPAYDYMYYKKMSSANAPGHEGSEVYCIGETAFPQSVNSSFSTIQYPVVCSFMGKEDPEDPDTYLTTFYEANIYSSSRERSFADYNYTKFLAYQPVGARMYSSKKHWRGNLLKNIKYRNSMPYHVTEYAYNIYEPDDLATLTTDAFTICNFISAPGDISEGTYDYGIGLYSIIPYNKTISYEGISQEDGYNSYKEYKYFYDRYTDALDYGLVRQLTEGNSEFEKTNTYYTYRRGKKYYLPLPETEIKAIDNTIVSATRTEYDPMAQLPIRKYSLSKECKLSELISTDQQTTANQISYINNLTYEYRYNTRGNLIEILYKGRPIASYIWGYNGLYPIIEATNVDYDTLSKVAISAGLTYDEINASSASSETKIISLTDVLKEKLPKSEITTVSYHWLLGVAKFTNPQGISSNYTFDARGRLVEVRDFNNYLINKYEYRYEKDDF